MNTKPDVFEYIDLQQYLRDIYAYRKKKENNFSYEKWAQELGLKSRSSLRMVVTGNRVLSDQVFQLFINNLKLDLDSLDYITLLFRYSTASSQELKESYGRQLIGKWKKHLSLMKVENVSAFLEDQGIPIVFTYFSKPNVSCNLEEIAEALHISKSRVRLAIQVLIKIGLLSPELDKNQNLIYVTKEPYFHIPADPKDNFIKSFHVEALKQSIAAYDLPLEQRKFRSLLLVMNDESFKQVEKMTKEFVQSVLRVLDQSNLNEKPLDKSRIYRLNMQSFPVSEEF